MATGSNYRLRDTPNIWPHRNLIQSDHTETLHAPIPWPCPLPVANSSQSQPQFTVNMTFSSPINSASCSLSTITFHQLDHQLSIATSIAHTNKFPAKNTKTENQPWVAPRDLLNWQRSGRAWKHSGGRGSP